MEQYAHGVKYEIQNVEKFHIVILSGLLPTGKSDTFCIYRRKEYGEWPVKDIEMACRYFHDLARDSIRPGVLKSLTLSCSEKPDTAWVLFSTGEETRGPNGHRALHYNEKSFSEVESSNSVERPPKQPEKYDDSISIRFQKIGNGKRDVLVLSRVPDLTTRTALEKSVKTTTVSVSMSASAGHWLPSRVHALKKRFDEILENFLVDGRSSMSFPDAFTGKEWVLHVVGGNEKESGILLALDYRPV